MSAAPTLLFVFVFVLIIVGLIVAVAYGKKRERERTQHLQAVANLLGWQFGQEAPLDWIPNMDKFTLFNQGHSRTVTNVMFGHTNGIKAALFDYVYVTGHGKHQACHYQSVVYFELRDLNLPFFSLRPEHFLHKVITAFGYQDIDFGNRPTFSSQFLLRGAEEQAIRNTLSNELLAFYETNQGACTDGGGNQLFIFRQGHRTSPQEARSFIDWGSKLQNLFPRKH